MRRGSIALARSLCYEIAGPTGKDDDTTGSEYGSVDIAEILSAEVERLRILVRNDTTLGQVPATTLNDTNDDTGE